MKEFDMNCAVGRFVYVRGRFGFRLGWKGKD